MFRATKSGDLDECMTVEYMTLEYSINGRAQLLSVMGF